MMKHTYINKPHFRKMPLKDFWYYYKFHVLAGVFFVFLLGTLIFELVTTKDPDLLINYFGTPPIKTETQVQMEHAFASLSGVSPKKTSFVTYTLQKFRFDANLTGNPMKYIDWENEPDDEDILMLQRIGLEMTAGDPSLVIADEGVIKLYATQGVFLPLVDVKTSYPGLTASSDTEDGKTHIYGISIENNPFFADIQTADKYLAIKIPSASATDQKTTRMFENAKALMTLLVQQ